VPSASRDAVAGAGIDPAGTAGSDDLAAAAAGLPEVAVDPAEAGKIDLVASGAVAPDRTVTLRLPLGSSPTPGEGLALRDLEGVLLAVLAVRSAEPGAESTTVAGELTAARRPDRPDYPELRPSPGDVRRLLAAGDWPEMVTALAGELPPTAAALATELADAGGRLLALAFAPGAPDDPAHHARVRAWRRVVAPHGDAVLLIVVPAELPPDPERAAAVSELVARNHGAARVVAVAEPDAAAAELPASGGATVLFTGLSGSGKSTIAGRLLVQLLETGRTVSLLDGDVVRTHLSKGLGFSRADRDTNVLRIGFVASEVTKHGGIAICAPIAPYDTTRQAVRAMVERYGRFVLVHVATPVEVCEARDRKGLYAKARAGEIPEFTGVSDPYEAPTDADIVVDTEAESADDAAARVVEHLRAVGVVQGPAS
jgi:sulfate adenylyltransferase